MSYAETDYLFKVVLIGDPAVGKSNLLLRFTDDRFEEKYVNTIGVDFKFRNIRLDGKTVKLQLWDTAGQDRFRTMTRSFYRGAHGIVLVYDVTQLTSFQSIDKWLQEVETYCGDGHHIPRLLIGNKCDLTNRAVDYDTAKAYAEHRGISFFEASAKHSTNVEQAFYGLASKIKELESSSRASVLEAHDHHAKLTVIASTKQPSRTGQNCC